MIPVFIHSQKLRALVRRLMPGQAARKSTHHPMNYLFYLKVFAWISIVALSCALFSTFWLPMLVGSVMAALLIKVAR